MKVLMINTVSGFGSTGSICVDIANILEQNGHECYIAYGQGISKYKKSFKIGGIIENHLHNLGSRLLGKQGYFSKQGTSNLIKYIKTISPDVIHLHNLHGNYLHLETLFNFLRDFKGKVVLTLHDCWAFTGKCSHYTTVKCYKWEDQCFNCPQVHNYPSSIFFDFSNEMYKDKERWFNSISNLSIHPVSRWLESEVSRSFLKHRPIKMVYNWIDHSIFKPTSGLDLSKYQLKEGKCNLIFVSASWKANTVKGDDLVKLAKSLSNEFQLIIVGENKIRKDLPSNCVCIDYVEGKEELAKLYSFADIYIHLSTEDTFGKVIAEALSCGTPVIVYNSTACPEIVGDNCGYIVEPRDIDAIIECIQNLRNVPKSYFTLACIRHVTKNFDLNQNVMTIIKDLYN